MYAIRRLYVIHLSLLAIIITGCSPLIAKYDQIAYERATSLKVESLVLVDKATESYANHEQEAVALMLAVEKAYQYANGRPKNEISARQWRIMKDPDRHLLGGFMKRWKEEDKLSPSFVKEAKQQVSDAYDQIIGLESGKIKEGDIQ